MKKFFNLLFLITVMLLSSPAFSETSEYSFVHIQDEKTGFEIARAIVPENFEVISNVEWTRDFENPARFSYVAKSNSDDVSFAYLSEKAYVDVLQGKELKNGEFDSDFRTVNKKKILASDYIKEVILSDYPQASDIALVAEKNMPDGMDEYLISLMYKKIDELNITAKADTRYAKIDITNPDILPYVATFSYDFNGKKYYQTFVTLFTSVEYQYTAKNKKNDVKDKKFWKMKGLYSYRVEQKNYDKYYNDFLIFAANSMPNNKAVMALEHVKQEMVIELNPSFVDVNKNSALKNKPSDLFRRYFEVGLPDYSYIESMIKPSLTQVRWLTNIMEPQNEFSYRNLRQVWRQSFYVPKKYEYVYLNKGQNKWVISTEPQTFDIRWKKLKKTKF